MTEDFTNIMTFNNDFLILFGRLLKSALAVSDYTDKIDRDTYRSKARRTHAILHEICAMISAVVVAWDYDAGVAQLDSRDFQKNATVGTFYCFVHD